MPLVSVLLPLKFDQPLTYSADQDLAPGAMVEVLLGNSKKIIGCVWNNNAGKVDQNKLKSISKVMPLPPLPQRLLDFVDWVARWTLSTRGQALKLALRENEIRYEAVPKKRLRLKSILEEKQSLPRQRVIDLLADGFARQRADILRETGVSAGVLATLLRNSVLEEVVVPEKPPVPLDQCAQRILLSKSQIDIAQVLRRHVQDEKFQPSLLHGVTGSGKTEVYFEAVAEAITQGKQALVLLPEISLTAQFLERFTTRFGAPPLEWHSQVSSSKRGRLWHQVMSGKAQVIVGARSSLFLPFNKLGLIVVDEEHEQAYRQEDQVLYHARDMAVVRARIENCPVILASATPSLESWINAEQGRYLKFDLPERYGEKSLPSIAALDMRVQNFKSAKWLSLSLREKLSETLQRGEQSLLFVNRRGYAPLTLCRSCGYRITCPQCSAYLVEHKRRARLQCHHCGFHQDMPAACPCCGTKDKFTSVGLGVERIADDVRAAFPQARVLTLSSDLTGGIAQLREEIDRIAKHKVDIVIGTQLVAKGHNFPGLTFVGVIDGDFSLGSGDPRAGERTFQTLNQVIGRAGRGSMVGSALVQTHAPDHPVLKALLAGDQKRFYEVEAEQRRAASLPPFGRLAAFIISDKEAGKAFGFAKALLKSAPPKKDVKILGPAEAPLSRLKGRYRYRLLVKAPREFDLQSYLKAWLAQAPKTKGSLRYLVDIDPYNFA